MITNEVVNPPQTSKTDMCLMRLTHGAKADMWRLYLVMSLLLQTNIPPEKQTSLQSSHFTAINLIKHLSSFRPPLLAYAYLTIIGYR